MYNNFYPQTQQNLYSSMRQTQIGLKGRPVSSLEEARASMIDFDGSVFYFPDLANRRIYTKQINMDGTALMNMYELKEIPAEPVAQNSSYVTREELEVALQDLRMSLTMPQPQTHEEVTATSAPSFNF